MAPRRGLKKAEAGTERAQIQWAVVKVRMSPDLARAVAALAASQEISVAAWVRLVVQAQVREAMASGERAHFGPNGGG